MSEQQQMQYPNPEHQADPDPRFIVTDPREQHAYGSIGPMYGEKLRTDPQMMPRRRSQRPWLILFFLIPILIAGLISLPFRQHSEFDGPKFDMHDSAKFGRLAPQSVFVTGVPTLVIQNMSGTIHIHSGDSANQVIVQDAGNTGDVKALVSKDNIVTITSSDSSEIDITTPSTTDVQIAGGSGDVNVEGITGNIAATTDSGSLTVNDVSGQVTLTDNNGSINASNVNGQIKMTGNNSSIVADHLTGMVNASSGDGSITVTASNLSSNSTFHSHDGSISVEGSIDTSGTYSFDSNSGSIDVSLPAASSFVLNASSTNGTVNNDFGRSSVGPHPQPTVTIKSNSGPITVHKQA